MAPLRSQAPWSVLTEVERRGTEVLAVQIMSKEGSQARLTLHRGADGRIDASTILTAVPCAGPVDAATNLAPDLRAQLTWVTTLLSSASAPSDAELRDRLSPTFLAAIPPEQFRAALAQLRALGPFTIRSYEGSPAPLNLTARVGVRTGEEARLELTIELGSSHRITAFAIRTQPPCRTPAR